MPLSQIGSYTRTHIDANVPDVVLHENTYRKYYVMTYISGYS
ncbi:hypothetical protein F383_24441 [Gossypium arboreum]|uniref:Uncharacterized protein n=1 Tax=Gossypium arboreum TaxID=29729 RepID=A0A0B0P5T9_GOSAR|nr:hypothetical protein F383_24441 [Gossypium arboreum]